MTDLKDPDVEQAKILSPFISITKSILRALHLAIKMGPESCIGVFSVKEVGKYSNIEKASALKLQPRCLYYSGGGKFDLLELLDLDADLSYNKEYLVWGSIHASCVYTRRTLTCRADLADQSYYQHCPSDRTS